MDLEKLYTVEDVARFTNLTTRTIRNYLKEGRLTGKKIGGQWRFTMENISTLLNDGKVKNDVIHSNEQELMDFINGVNTDLSGQMQICSVADYYCNSPRLAAEFGEKLVKLVSEYKGNTDTSFNHYYDEKENKARYIFLGEPEFIIMAMETLREEWKLLTDNLTRFTGKAENYFKGRPDYPSAFMDYLYQEMKVKKTDVIADIGSGVGKISRLFLEKGNTVYCVEPNREMRMISDELLNHYKHYIPLAKTAEDTGIQSDSVNYIFCGNAYDYFDRRLTKPEFKRILKKGGKVIIAYHGAQNTAYLEEFGALVSKYGKESNKRDYRKIFADGSCIEKEFSHSFMESYEDFVAGCRSHSRVPIEGTENDALYLKGLEEIFKRYEKDGKIETAFKLKIQIGDVEDLLI